GWPLDALVKTIAPRPFRVPLLAGSLAAFVTAIAAQNPVPSSHPWPQHHWIVPSRAVIAPVGAVPVQIVRADVRIRMLDRAASTVLELELHNPAATQQEAVLLLPLPDGAAVSEFTFEG